MNLSFPKIIPTFFFIMMTLSVCFAMEEAENGGEENLATVRIAQQAPRAEPNSILAQVLSISFSPMTEREFEVKAFRTMHSSLARMALGSAEIFLGVNLIDLDCPGFSRAVLNSIFSFVTSLGNYKYGSTECTSSVLTYQQGGQFSAGERFNHDKLLCPVGDPSKDSTPFQRHKLCTPDEVYDNRVQYMGTPFETVTICQTPVNALLAQQYMESALGSKSKSSAWYAGVILTGHGVLELSWGLLQFADSTIKTGIMYGYQFGRLLFCWR